MRKRYYFAIALVVILILIYRWLMIDFPKTESLIFFNGDILTMEDDLPTASAIFVEKGIIKFIGSKEEIFNLKNEETEIIDLEGRTLMPGFIDPHTHPAISTFLYNMVDLSGFTHQTPEGLWSHLEAAIPKFEKGDWIICKGLDPILVKGLHAPHISFLDSIAPENPLIIISQSLHSYWANSQAFASANISKSTPDPSSTSFYEKDENGDLTGFIAEQEAFQPFGKIFEEVFTLEMMVRTTEKVLEDYAKNGNTSIVSTGLTIEDGKPLRLYEHLSSENPKLLNQILATLNYFPERKPMVRHFMYMRHDRSELLPDSPNNGNDFYRFLGVKHWYDGSPYTGSMFLKEPYDTSELTEKGLQIPKGYKGERLVEKEELIGFIKNYQQKGWQIAVHTQGDQATEEVIDAFEEVNQSNDITSFRHRLEHCLLLSENSIKKMSPLNMTPSIHINHLYYYGEALQNEIIGEERAQQMLPVNTLKKNNLKFSLHADQPMFESDPFHLIQTAITRKTKEGTLLGEEEKISILEGLKAMTIDAAWQIKMENKIGSIKIGKYADLIILNTNPLQTPVEKLTQIKVEGAFVAGNVLF